MRLLLALLLVSCGGSESIVCENVCPTQEPAPNVSPGDWMSCACPRSDGQATYYFLRDEASEDCALRRLEWEAVVANGCHG